jgi:protein phosphatase PTC7
MLLRRFASNFFTCGSHSIIGYGKNKGEDAFYFDKNLLSIADGVGGWTLQGVDPSKYAWELMKNVEKVFKNSPDQEKTSFNVLKKAASNCKEKGSSTCCLIVLDPQLPTIDTINVGDSGFYIYRKVNQSLNLVDKSTEVLHGFNFPFQLGTNGDRVEKGSIKRFDVQDKDFIVMYTDGISDNLFEDMTRNILKDHLFKDFELNFVAKTLAENAFELSINEHYFSPFSKAAMAMKAGGREYTGGKPDDITVIIAQISLFPHKD